MEERIDRFRRWRLRTVKVDLYPSVQRLGAADVPFGIVANQGDVLALSSSLLRKSHLPSALIGVRLKRDKRSFGL